MNICKHCGKENRSGILVCEHCGLLPHQVSTRLFSEDSQITTRALVITEELNTDFFVTLYIPSSNETIRLQNASEVLLGRFEDGTPSIPCVDFGNFDGLAKGVSRLHASVKRQGKRVFLVDRNSSNGTYVNGQRIDPGEEARVYDGDKILLGSLTTRIHIG